MLGPIGALFLAVPTLTNLDRKPVLKLGLFGGGAALTIYGGALAASVTSQNMSLQQKLEADKARLLADRESRIFVIFSSFTEEWQAELNGKIVANVNSAGFRAEVFCPSKSYSEGEYRRILETVTRKREHYSGGIVVASLFPDHNMEEVTEFLGRVDLPIVLLDYGSIDCSDLVHLPGSSRLAWISIRDGIGGRLAAEAAAAATPSATRVLVIAGPGKHQRQDEFRSQLHSRMPNCTVIVTEDGCFDRARAEEVAMSYFGRARIRNVPFDLVFCTADSMTLGCIDAVRAFDWRGSSPPMLIGYDGVEATKKLALHEESMLQRVVIQDAEKMAELAVRELKRLQAGILGPIICPIDPHLYPAETI